MIFIGLRYASLGKAKFSAHVCHYPRAEESVSRGACSSKWLGFMGPTCTGIVVLGPPTLPGVLNQLQGHDPQGVFTYSVACRFLLIQQQRAVKQMRLMHHTGRSFHVVVVVT